MHWPLSRKGQALQFNWLFEKEAFILHPDGRFSVNFDKVWLGLLI